MQKIDEGSAGVRNCIWAPDGCSILVVADFQIRISVYSLLDHSVKLMRGPKYPDKGISFSPDGQLLAYAEVFLSVPSHKSSQSQVCSLYCTDCRGPQGP